MTGHETRLALSRRPVRSLLWAAWIAGGLALTGIVEAPPAITLATGLSGPLVPAALTGLALASGLMARRSSTPSPSPALAAGAVGLLFVGLSFRPSVSVAGLLITTLCGGWAIGAASASAAAAAPRGRSAAAGLTLAAAAGGLALLPLSPLWLLTAAVACLVIRALTHEPDSPASPPTERNEGKAVVDSALTPGESGVSEKPGGSDEAVVLVASDVAHRFGDRVVLRDARLALRAGELVGLAGGNGSGKSTLLRILGGHLVPDRGDVLLDGASVLGAAPEELCRAGVTLVSGARPVFPDLTVEENLQVAGWSVAPGERDRSRSVGLDTFPELTPLLARTAGTLSGGEQRLVALAQSLAVRPRVLLADEVTLGLSPSVRHRVWGLLRQLADEGSAVLVVDHELAGLSALSDRVLVLDGGTLTEGPAASGAARFIRLDQTPADPG